MSGNPWRYYPHAKPSFPVPMVPPTADPWEAPLVSAAWNEEYTPYILGALSQLLLESSWKVYLQPDYTMVGKMNSLFSIIGNAAPNTLPSVVHSRTFNFASSEDDWSVVGGLYGVWVPDVGWCSEGWNAATSQWWSRLDIGFNLPTARPIRTIYAPSVEIDQSGWSGVPFTLDVYSSAYALSPGGLFVSQHWQYTMIPGYTNSPFEINVSTVAPVNVSSGRVEVHVNMRGFTVDPDGFSPPIRVSIPSLTLEWFEPT